jgi:hypothetical protein
LGRKGAGRGEESGKKEGRWAGPAVGKGLDRLGLFFSQIHFKQLFKHFLKIQTFTFLIQTSTQVFPNFSTIILRTFKVSQQQNSCIPK